MPIFHFVSVVWSVVTDATGLGDKPRPPPPQRHFPALPKEPRGASRPGNKSPPECSGSVSSVMYPVIFEGEAS